MFRFFRSGTASAALVFLHRTRILALLLSVLIAVASILVKPAGTHAAEGDQVTGISTSTLIPCAAVGRDFRPNATNPYVSGQKVLLRWKGTPSAARLTAYEFNASSQADHDIFINGTRIGSAKGTRDTYGLCEGFEGVTPLAWPVPPELLNNGYNEIKISIASDSADQSWGLSRAQLEVTGSEVDGPRTEMVSIPSSYHDNWQGYRNEGTWTQVQIPSRYSRGAKTPLLILAHGYGDSAVEPLWDFGPSADEATRGWLVASADYHGEVNFSLGATGGVWNPYPEKAENRIGTRNMGSRAAQWDIMDVVAYMKSHYNVDSTRIYLAGESMGSTLVLLAGARWPDQFAAVASYGAPTDMSAWEAETATGGSTPAAWMHTALISECGAYKEPFHLRNFARYPAAYPFEYQRRSPVRFASNYKHLPLFLVQASEDTRVAAHHAADMFDAVSLGGPDELAPIRYYSGDHGGHLDEWVPEMLAWLGMHQRQADYVPRELSFALDWSGRHFWIDIQLSSDDLSEAHWVRVPKASFDRAARQITAEVENLYPDIGDPAKNGGVEGPHDMTVKVGFELATMGLPTQSSYTVEQIDRRSGIVTTTVVTATNGSLTVAVGQGSYGLRIAGPPVVFSETLWLPMVVR